MQDRTRIFPGRLTPGTRLNDTYEIDGLIGSGGMGEIYRGHNIHTGDAVAIKLVRLDVENDATALGLFQREASALSRLHHEAIVRYQGFSIDPLVRRHYLVMEFVDGPSLSQLLEQGPLGFEAVEALRRRVAAGLAAAHAGGIIHRDVSPDNIIMPGGDVAFAKIIDFGIARSSLRGQATIIGTGFAGKYNYVAPEQLGLAGGAVTARSDLYSFGLVLAEAICGQPLDMSGTEAEVVEKRRRVPDLGAVDERLRPLIARMLSPDPADRPDSMAAVAAWSPAPAAQGAAVPSGQAKPLRQPRRAGKGHLAVRVATRGAIALVLLGAGFLAYTLISAQPERPPARTPTTLIPNPNLPHPLASAGPLPGGGSVLPPEPSAAPPESVVSAPTAPQPATTATPDKIGEIARYIDTYEGGPCFFVAAVRIASASAAIESFAKADDAFTSFEEAFTQFSGFDPDIKEQKVYSAQCAAVDFLRQATRQGQPAPVLDLKSIRLKTGQSLAGEVRGYGGSKLALLLVQEDGAVRDLSPAAREDGDARVFSVPMLRPVSGGPFPQMLIAVTSSQPLDALSSDGTSAESFFRKVLAEAASKGVKLGAAAQLLLFGE